MWVSAGQTTTTKREELQNQPGKSDLEMFAFFTAAAICAPTMCHRVCGRPWAQVWHWLWRSWCGGGIALCVAPLLLRLTAGRLGGRGASRERELASEFAMPLLFKLQHVVWLGRYRRRRAGAGRGGGPRAHGGGVVSTSSVYVTLFGTFQGPHEAATTAHPGAPQATTLRGSQANRD